MFNSYPNSPQIRSKLTQIYQKLPEKEKQMVRLFSVIYEPVNRTAFLSCLTPSGIKDEKEKAFNSKTLKPYLDRLISLGLILQEGTKAPQCHPLLAEIATRDAIKTGDFETLAKVVEEKFPINKRYMYMFETNVKFLRELRLCIYRHQLENIGEMFEDYHQYCLEENKLSWTEALLQIGNNPFDADWLCTLPLELYENIISNILTESFQTLTPADSAFELLCEQCFNQGKYSSDYLRLLLSEQLLLRGKYRELEANLPQISANYRENALVFEGWFYFIQGDNEKAIATYTEAYKHLQKATRKKKTYFNTLAGIFFILALIKEASTKSLQQARDYAYLIAKDKNHWLSFLYTRLEQIISIQQGEVSQKESILETYIPSYRGLRRENQEHSIATLFACLSLYWVASKQAKKSLPPTLEGLLNNAQKAGYDWIAGEIGELLTRLKPNHKQNLKAKVLLEDQGIQTLADLIKPQEEWELCLKALIELQSQQSKSSTTSTSTGKRLAWFITLYIESWHLQPREQSLNKKGEWTKGRPIALKRLKTSQGEFNYLTPQDLKVCSQLQLYTSGYGYYRTQEYRFKPKAISELIGHPLVFWEDNPHTRIEVIEGEPELLVKKDSQNQISLQFKPQLDGSKNTLVIKETPTCLKIITIKPEHRRIAEIIGKKNKLIIPAQAEAKVLEAINSVAPLVTIHSDIGGGAEDTPQVPSHSLPHIHLLPAGEGLKVALLSRPFGDSGPYYRPGNGGETVIAEIKGQRLQTKRDLKLEKKLATETISQCPTFNKYSENEGEWLIDNPEDCLELLLQLQELEQEVIVEWPQGEKFKVTHRANFENLRLQIKRQQDWFAVNGELQLDDSLVLELQQLLELLENSPSRFVPLGEGEFLALTAEFRQRLAEFNAFSQKQGQGRRLHPLSSLALQEFVDEVGQIKADKHWKAHLKRLREIENLEPELPTTLQAELRDYQIEGFKWLARLSHWGVGACLADDMGLGKTLQALAVILTRAPQGGTLIIAPTSVCFNWQSEAEKFAPTLNPIMFASKNRQKILDEIEPFDLLICSYGLLQQEEVAEMLAQVQWQTIVLDEAQAIKNIATKRSQGAMKLQGELKIITTGTPIENHLGELWNLFRFINPGLLGSKEQFNQRFAQPIEKDKDKQARQQLKKLIQPFLLRRTKNQVLTELPSRTEITLQVELSKEEMALYEALRREAIAKLDDSDGSAGQKHLQVLAEIMRLRRACCHPRLVMPDASLSSSKLEVFGDTLTELLDNRHKALVFSQFVAHLQIIKDYLQQEKISYQYLDGSTSTSERQKRVKAFQSGEGDVFLISLKAGGTGLNLTAADYVIHLDPWWNPAVEDQASDRAHRIGQKRPVTIYRLVAKNTIEEKIVQLHSRKRDLADSLLEGSDVSGKISTEELLSLIREL